MYSSRVACSRISQFLTRISFKDLNKKGVFNIFENQGTVLSILLFFSTLLSIPCSVFSLRLFTLFSFQICYPFFPIFLHLLLPLMFYYYSICSLSVSLRVFRSFYYFFAISFALGSVIQYLYTPYPSFGR